MLVLYCWIIIAYDAYNFTVLSQDCFGSLGSFMVPHQLQDYFLVSVKNTSEILMEVAWNLDCLGSMDILTIFFFHS